MDISKYVSYFHDGTIIDIQQIGDAISISMESCELSIDELDEDIVLTDTHTLKGKLHLKKLNSISMNNTPMFTSLKKLADIGEILEFQVLGNRVRILIQWINFPPNKPIKEVSDIIIQSEDVSWENIPDLYDPFV
jgi:hypothetical protein